MLALAPAHLVAIGDLRHAEVPPGTGSEQHPPRLDGAGDDRGPRAGACLRERGGQLVDRLDRNGVAAEAAGVGRVVGLQEVAGGRGLPLAASAELVPEALARRTELQRVDGLVATVAVLRCNRRAICGAVWPSAMSTRISCSRELSSGRSSRVRRRISLAMPVWADRSRTVSPRATAAIARRIAGDSTSLER
jgi:hypothetical protein